MKGNTLRREWLDFWDFSPDMASISAFCQQRQKLLPEAMDFLFHSFNDTFLSLNTYSGFRLLAADGSDLAIAHNPNDKETHRRHNSLERNEKGYNQLHLNALYDLKNRIYVDTIIQPGRSPNEPKALIDMMERSKIQESVLLIADRGYESYNIMAHAQEKGWKFLIRAKDLGSRGILTHLPIPDSGSFDCTLSLILTRKQTKEIKSQPQRYRCLIIKHPVIFLIQPAILFIRFIFGSCVFRSQRTQWNVSLRIWIKMNFLWKKSKNCTDGDGELSVPFGN